MPVCMFVVDARPAAGAILAANRRAERLFGRRTAELTGLPLAELVPADSRPTLAAVLERAAQGETAQAEAAAQRADGSRFPVRLIASPAGASPAGASPAGASPAGASPHGDHDHTVLVVEDLSGAAQRRSEAEAIDAERRRIAHEIHDGIAQSLGGLRFKSALWQHMAGDGPSEMRAALDEVQTVLEAAIADLRRAIYALHPLDLEAQGFFPALGQLVADCEDRGQLTAELAVSGRPDALPPAYVLPLYRVLQEALNNVSRHAHARGVRVALHVDPDGAVSATVTDDGRGFDPSRRPPGNLALGQAHAGHFGLRQMRERLLDLGGALDVTSAAGRGTALRITLPPPICPIDLPAAARADRPEGASDAPD